MNPRAHEYVLGTPTANLPSEWLPEAGHFLLDSAQWSSRLSALQAVWRLRSEAETDLGLKQWIPYALLRKPDGQIAAYPRQGTEARLHGLWSLGVGGHVNPGDAPDGFAGGLDWPTVLERALRRELHEEYPGAACAPVRFLGLVHECQTTVGQAHIGAVYQVDLSADPGPPGAELTGLQWVPREALGSPPWKLERFELWSRLALHLLPANTIA